jgi:dihydrolipoamide dehydrogenase
MARVRSERDRFVGFVVDAVEQLAGRTPLQGHARFVDDAHAAGGPAGTRRCARSASSSPPARGPRAAGLAQALGDRLIVNDDVFDWTDLPSSVAVVGTGVIGLELAQALHRLGVRVRLYGRSEPRRPAHRPGAAGAGAQVFGGELPLSWTSQRPGAAPRR